MSVDLSKAIVGQVVHFRDGGTAKIKAILAANDRYISLGFEGLTTNFSIDGYYGAPWHNGPWDIIQLSPPSFDWKDAMPGMAFSAKECNGCDVIWFYVGKIFPSERAGFVFDTPEGFVTTYAGLPMRRCPDHDRGQPACPANSI